MIEKLLARFGYYRRPAFIQVEKGSDDVIQALETFWKSQRIGPQKIILDTNYDYWYRIRRVTRNNPNGVPTMVVKLAKESTSD